MEDSKMKEDDDGQKSEPAVDENNVKVDEESKTQTENAEVENNIDGKQPKQPAGVASETSQQALTGNPSTVGAQSQMSAESSKIVSFNELVEALDTETGTKTYTNLPAPSTTSISESILSDIFNSAVTPFMNADSAAAMSMGSSESKDDEGNGVQVVENRDSGGKRVSFQVPNSTDVDKP